MLVNVDSAAEQKIKADIADRRERFEKNWEIYTKTNLDPYEKERVPKVKESQAAYRSELAKTMAMVSAGQRQEAYDYYQKNAAQHINNVNMLLIELAEYNSKVADEINLKNDKDYEFANKLLMGVPVLAIIIALFTGSLIARMIAGPLKKMMESVQEVAAGNLSVKTLDIDSADEVGQLAAAFNTMTANLRDLVRRITQSAEQVAASSEELTASAEQTALAINQVAGTINVVAPRRGIPGERIGFDGLCGRRIVRRSSASSRQCQFRLGHIVQSG